MNYCVEFYAEQTDVSPSEVYVKLNEISPMPFSAYFKMTHTCWHVQVRKISCKKRTKIISAYQRKQRKEANNDRRQRNHKEIILERGITPRSKERML